MNKNKKKILNNLETRPHTNSWARKISFDSSIDLKQLNQFWLGDIEPMGTKKYFFSKKNKNEFKKFIISNRDYSVEIKKNLKRKKLTLNLRNDEKIRKCTKCKEEFITKIDPMGVSYDTRCKRCKTIEKYDHSGRLNGKLGKLDRRGN